MDFLLEISSEMGQIEVEYLCVRSASYVSVLPFTANVMFYMKEMLCVMEKVPCRSSNILSLDICHFSSEIKSLIYRIVYSVIHLKMLEHVFF